MLTDRRKLLQTLVAAPLAAMIPVEPKQEFHAFTIPGCKRVPDHNIYGDLIGIPIWSREKWKEIIDRFTKAELHFKETGEFVEWRT